MLCGCFEALAGVHGCSDVAVRETFRNEWTDKNSICIFLFFFFV